MEKQYQQVSIPMFNYLGLLKVDKKNLNAHRNHRHKNPHKKMHTCKISDISQNIVLYP